MSTGVTAGSVYNQGLYESIHIIRGCLGVVFKFDGKAFHKCSTSYEDLFARAPLATK